LFQAHDTSDANFNRTRTITAVANTINPRRNYHPTFHLLTRPKGTLFEDKRAVHIKKWTNFLP
jgi:hypothetical protein